MRVFSQQDAAGEDFEERAIAQEGIGGHFPLVFRHEVHIVLQPREPCGCLHFGAIPLHARSDSTRCLWISPPVGVVVLFESLGDAVRVFQPWQKVIITLFEDDFGKHRQPDGEADTEAKNLDGVRFAPSE